MCGARVIIPPDSNPCFARRRHAAVGAKSVPSRRGSQPHLMCMYSPAKDNSTWPVLIRRRRRRDHSRVERGRACALSGCSLSTSLAAYRRHFRHGQAALLAAQ
eukprot:3483534-Prymnesium_polylepis.1